MPKQNNSASRGNLVRRFIGRSTIYLVFCGLTVALLKVLHDQEGFSPFLKVFFNVFWIYLSLGLGGAALAAFGDIARVVRWKILVSGKFKLRQVNLILGLSDPQSVIRFGGATHDKPLLVLACFAWVFLLFATQIGVGMMGIFYDLDTVAMVHFTPGLVNITDMRNFYPEPHGDRSLEPEYGVQQSTAHFYGEMATNFPYGVPGTSNYREYPLPEPYPNANSTQWIYYFQESINVEQKGGGFIQLSGNTNRSVKVTPQCEYHPIVGGQYAGAEGTNVTISIGGQNVTINWMRGWDAAATTYVNPSEYSSNTDTCGPRCSRIYIFQSVDKTWNPPAETGSFFNCTTTISQVQNANPLQPLHSMPDRTAMTAAGAIGLGGYSDDSSRQFVQYKNSTAWGKRLGNSTRQAELLVGKYTVGVIAAYNIYGPSVEVMGLKSKLETHLSVDWSPMLGMLGFILGAQLIGWVLAFYCRDSMPDEDDSHYSTTRLIRPLLERLENSGSTSAGHETLRSSPELVLCNVRPDASSGRRIYSLDVAED